MNDKGNKDGREIDVEKITKSLLIGNITFIITAAVSIGVYLATINQHTKAIDETAKAVALVDLKAQHAVDVADSKTSLIEKQANKRITEIAEAGLARDTINEKSVIAIEGKLGRIEDKLDSALTDLRDIKKIVLKPIAKADAIDTNAIPEHFAGIMNLK